MHRSLTFQGDWNHSFASSPACSCLVFMCFLRAVSDPYNLGQSGHLLSKEVPKILEPSRSSSFGFSSIWAADWISFLPPNQPAHSLFPRVWSPSWPVLLEIQSGRLSWLPRGDPPLYLDKKGTTFEGGASEVKSIFFLSVGLAVVFDEDDLSLGSGSGEVGRGWVILKVHK